MFWGDLDFHNYPKPADGSGIANADWRAGLAVSK